MAAQAKSRKTDFQAAFEGFAAGAFGQTGKLRWFALFEWWIDAATNEKWVSRRLLTCGLGFNLIMVLLVRLFANKVKRQSALFCKMGGYGFVCNQFNFQAADMLVSFIIISKPYALKMAFQAA